MLRGSYMPSETDFSSLNLMNRGRYSAKIPGLELSPTQILKNTCNSDINQYNCNNNCNNIITRLKEIVGTEEKRRKKKLLCLNT